MKSLRTNRQFKPVKSKYLVITNDYLIPMIIIIGISLLYLTAFKTTYFNIANMICERDFESCQDPFILAEIEKSKNTNIFKFESETLINKLKSGNKTIKDIEISKKLPSTINIGITSTSPRVALSVETNGNKWIILDDNLRVISTSDQEPNLPIVLVQATQEIQLGQTIDNDSINEALTLALDITEQFIRVKTIKLDKEIVTLFLPSGKKVLLTTLKDTNKQLLTLQAILADDTIMREETYNIIDVRFDQPVLKSTTGE